jgi:predicted enzyme related to lactoylglutathione lyase
MLGQTHSFAGFAAKDLDAAYQFYTATLGLDVTKDDMGLHIHQDDHHEVYVYHKPNHEPAGFTVLYFVVEDIDATVADMNAKGVKFEHYPGLNPAADIARGFQGGADEAGEGKDHGGPDIAWFTDPSGNIMAVLAKVDKP